MEQKGFVLINKGMRRDITISKVGESAAFDNRNIRITATDKDTLLSVTNERGNKKIENLEFDGTLIGYGVLNNYLILFTADGDVSRIYRVEYSGGTFRSILIFSGDLKFSDDYPIETIVDYETEDIQKIYWLDGKNVLRYLNFSDTYLKSHLTTGELYNNPVFDFKDDAAWFDSNRPSTSSPSVTIEKDFSGVARPNGTAQYFISYYNKNGQQTGIVWSSPLVYLSPADRGGAADQTNTCVVTLSMSGLDTTFDYVRLYQIVRTTQDGQVVAYLVGESATQSGKATIVDNGTHLETVDPTSFLYLGSVDVIAGTMTHKDNVLFLGNLKSVGNVGVDDLQSTINANAFILHNENFQYGIDWESNIVSFTYSSDATEETSGIPYVTATGYYPYENQLKYTNAQISTFKGGEKYRFALRFIRANGTMSKSFWVGDKVNPYYPVMKSSGNISRPLAVCKIPTVITEAATVAGFSGVQLMIAEATYADRSVQAQGVVSPTMFNLYDRVLGRVFAQSSWLFRHLGGNNYLTHLSSLSRSDTSSAELQCNWWDDTSVAPCPLFGVVDGKFKNAPTGFSNDITSLRIIVDVLAQRFPSATAHGYITIQYFADGSETPVKTFKRNLGKNGFWNKTLSKRRIVEAWLSAYEDADIPVEYRATTDTMYKTIDEAFDNCSGASWGKATYANPSGGGTLKLNYTSLDKSNLYAKYNREYFFEDESIVTLNSPEITYEAVNLDRNNGLKFRIVGAARLTGNISDYDIKAVDSAFIGDNLLSLNFSKPNISNEITGLSAWPLFIEKGYRKKLGEDEYEYLDTPYYYMTYMWHKSGSIPDYSDNAVQWSILTKKIFANLRFSMYTVYNNYGANTWSVTPDDLRQINSLSADMYELRRGVDKVNYLSNVDSVISVPEDVNYPIYYSNEIFNANTRCNVEATDKTVPTPVHMTYHTEPHAVLSLPYNNNVETILPYIYSDEAFNIDSIDSGLYAPWYKSDYSGKRLLYRSINPTDSDAVADLTQGCYGQFSSGYLNAVSNTYSGITDVEGLWGLRNAIMPLKLQLQRSIYAILNIQNDGLTKQYFVDVYSIFDDSTGVSARIIKYANYPESEFEICVRSEIPISKVSGIVYFQGGSFEYSQVVNENTDCKIIVKNPVLPYGKTPTSFSCTVEYSYSYKNSTGVKCKLIPDLNIPNAQLYYDDDLDSTYYRESFLRYAGVHNASVIDPLTNVESVEFVNVQTVPNYIYILDKNHTFTQAGIYDITYKKPLQEQYAFDNYGMLSNGCEYLFIGELYKDYDELSRNNVALDTRYGGVSESAVEACTFVKAGPVIKLNETSIIERNSSAELDCNAFFERLIGLDTFSDKSFSLDFYGKNKQLEHIDLSMLNQLAQSSFYPTSENMVTTLSVECDSDGNWYSVISDFPDAILTNLMTDPNYKIVLMRYGYARRGKYRMFIDKRGNYRNSYTTRRSLRDTDGTTLQMSDSYRHCRKGERNRLPAKRYRIIGVDLLISGLSMEEQLASSTWKLPTGQRTMDYKNSSLVTDYAAPLTLPPLRKGSITRNGRFAQKAKNGIRDLFIGLYHKENGSWRLCSNICQVRGCNSDKTMVWEFVESNIAYSASDIKQSSTIEVAEDAEHTT